MKTAAHILRSKAIQTVHAIAPDVSVFEAVRLMAEKGIGALVVMEGSRLVGLITERDYARKIALMDRSSRDTLVREVMTSDVLCVGPENTSEECMALMTEKQVRHLPVVDGDRLLGIISIGDLVKDIISDQRFIIEQLEHYIAGVKG